MTFFVSSEDKTLKEGVVLEWVGAELKAGAMVGVDNGPKPLRRARIIELGQPTDDAGRTMIDVVANVMISGENFGLRQLHCNKLGRSLWVITGGPYNQRLAA